MDPSLTFAVFDADRLRVGTCRLCQSSVLDVLRLWIAHTVLDNSATCCNRHMYVFLLVLSLSSWLSFHLLADLLRVIADVLFW